MTIKMGEIGLTAKCSKEVKKRDTVLAFF